jgi:hypothetical protein
MPDIQDVFRMSAQKVKPDPGALERQHRGQRRRSLQRKAETYALVGALLIVGTVLFIGVLRHVTEGPTRPASAPGISPGGVADQVPAVEELPPTVDRLAGIWLMEGESLMLSFGSDGMFAFIPDGDVGGFGTYEVDGQTITFVYTGGRFCSGGFEWNASLLGDGRLRAMNVSSSSPCEPERQVGLETTWTQVSPRSAAVEEITADVSPGVFRPLPPESGSILHGVWLLEGNGILLRLGADGSYAIDDGGELVTDPDDVGTFEVDGVSGTLTFTSGADSRTCAEDDVWVWTNAELGEGVLRVVVTEEGCGKDLEPDLVWVRLQPTRPVGR